MDNWLTILIIVFFLLGLFLGIFLFWKIRKWWLKLKLKRQFAKARKGEFSAEKFLIDLGYKVIETQARMPLTLLLDDEPWETDIIADLVVRRNGKTYIAEVKTGVNAPSIKTAATRRQLLEYYVTYKPDSILLVDMTAKELHTVDFLL
jgi:hypothetical protein